LTKAEVEIMKSVLDVVRRVEPDGPPPDFDPYAPASASGSMGPFFECRIVLIDGSTCALPARSAEDAVWMLDTVWGPGFALSCEQTNEKTEPVKLVQWKLHWREWLANVRQRFDERNNPSREATP
jgi:hypothetical protein